MTWDKKDTKISTKTTSVCSFLIDKTNKASVYFLDLLTAIVNSPFKKIYLKKIYRIISLEFIHSYTVCCAI